MEHAPQSQSTPHARGTVLIVDDNPDNLGFLFDSFIELGYKVLVALNGWEALEQLALIKPDIILLDAMMPRLDGFETCKRIKENPSTWGIPVIFMSALGRPEDKVRGFAAGAVDYVTKPVHKEEVLARVHAHVSLTTLRRELEERNQELQTFSRMVAHNLKDPLTTIIGCTELILDEWGSADHQTLVEAMPAEAMNDVKLVRDTGLRMRETIEGLLLLAGVSQDTPRLVALDMRAILDEVSQDLTEIIRVHGGVLSYPDTWPKALGAPAWIKQVWSNYITNGLKYGGKPPMLRLGADNDHPTMVKFWIRDNGVGLPDTAVSRIFEPFTRFHTRIAPGHGLGLSIVHRIITKLGGEVNARCLDAGGSEFSFTLPRV